MWVIGDCLFDPESRRLLLDQTERRLSPKACGVLMALAEAPRQVWSRDALLERVWPKVNVGEEVLTHAISELRRAFSDNAKAPRYVATVHKSGYRLVAPVRKEERETHGRVPPSQSENVVVPLATYASYLSAQDLYERGERHCIAAAADLLSQVVAASPTFAMGHIALAKALTMLDTFFQRGERRLEAAFSHCETAHRITAGSADAYAAQGFILTLQNKQEAARQYFMSAVQIRPDDGETHHMLALASCPTLEPQVAALLFERTARLRPRDYYSLLRAGTLRLKGDVSRARASFAAALQRIEAQLDAYPSDEKALSAKARCLWELQRQDDAFAIVNEIGRDADLLNYQLAGTLARAGELDRAAIALELVVNRGFRYGAWLTQDPDFENLIDHPRFKRITAALG